MRNKVTVIANITFLYVSTNLMPVYSPIGCDKKNRNGYLNVMQACKLVVILALTMGRTMEELYSGNENM